MGPSSAAPGLAVWLEARAGPAAQALGAWLLLVQAGRQLQAVFSTPCAFLSLGLQLEFPGPRHPDTGHLWRHQKCWTWARAKQGHAAFAVRAQCPRVRNMGSQSCLQAGFIPCEGRCFSGQPREDTAEQKKSGL